MEMTLKLGDHMLIISPTNKVDHGHEHACIAIDLYTGTTEIVHVLDEARAIRVTQDFLRPSGPIGLYAELFHSRHLKP